MNDLELRGSRLHVGWAPVYPNSHPDSKPIEGGELRDKTVTVQAVVQASDTGESFLYIDFKPDSGRGFWLNRAVGVVAVPEEDE